MRSRCPSFAEVKSVVGDKVLDAISQGVTDARDRLRVYRQRLPDHAAESTQRGLANNINDWMWASLLRSLEGAGGVRLSIGEPTH